MSRLKLGVPLGEGESPASFCSRLAARNCCDTVSEFCRDTGLSFRDVVDGKTDALARLGELGGTKRGAIGRSAIRRIGGGYHCMGQDINRAMLRRNRVVICPACLLEDITRNERLGVAAPYGRTAWLLAPIRTCPEHSLPLMEVARADAAKGQNGLAIHDFVRRIEGVIGVLERWADATDRTPASDLECYLLRRLRRQPTEGTEWLDVLPFHAVAKVCEMVGAIEIGGAKVDFRRLGREQWCEAGGAGYRLLASGPDGIRPLLEHLFRQPGATKGDIGPRTYLGHLYNWLFHHKDGAYEPLRDIVREITANRLAMGPKETIFGRPIAERRLHSVRSASQAIDVHPKRLRKLLRLGGFLDDSSESVADDLAVFPADARAAAFLSCVENSMPLKAAGEYINAPRVQLFLLHDAGLIEPFVRGGGDIKDHAYDRRDLDDFLHHLLADATDLEPGEGNLADIPLAARRARCLATDVVSMLLDRRLKRVRRRPGVEGYMSVLVDPVEIRALSGLAPRPGLSLSEVHSRMGWSRPVATALVDCGLLPSKTIINPVTGMSQRTVDAADLDRFDGEYVSLFALARQRDIHFLALMDGLSRQGVQPVFGIGDVPARFYRRADLPPA